MKKKITGGHVLQVLAIKERNQKSNFKNKAFSIFKVSFTLLKVTCTAHAFAREVDLFHGRKILTDAHVLQVLAIKATSM